MWKQLRDLILDYRYWILGLLGTISVFALSDWPAVWQYCWTTLKIDQCLVLNRQVWDWLDLLIAPALLALTGVWIDRHLKARDDRQRDEERRKETEQVEREKEAESLRLKQEKDNEVRRLRQEREVADDRGRQLVLKDYLDQMTSLLLDSAWPREEEKVEQESKRIIAVARARTLAVLRELDGERKGALVQFLIESRAIKFISLSKSDLREANLENTDISNADLRGADLRNANLKSAKLSHVDLRDAICVGIILTDANLSDASLCGIDLTHADLTVADLPRANLDDATIRGANLLEVNFESASLVGVNFQSTNLEEAILKDANLTLSYFKDANVRGADFRGALLIGTCLEEARDLDIEQLEGEDPPYLCNVSLPSIISIESNYNCDTISQLLVEKYGMSPEEAERFLRFAAPTIRS